MHVHSGVKASERGVLVLESRFLARCGGRQHKAWREVPSKRFCGTGEGARKNSGCSPRPRSAARIRRRRSTCGPSQRKEEEQGWTPTQVERRQGHVRAYPTKRRPFGVDTIRHTKESTWLETDHTLEPMPAQVQAGSCNELTGISIGVSCSAISVSESSSLNNCTLSRKATAKKNSGIPSQS